MSNNFDEGITQSDGNKYTQNDSHNRDVSMVDVNNLHESLSQMSIDDDSRASLQGFTPLTRQLSRTETGSSNKTFGNEQSSNDNINNNGDFDQQKQQQKPFSPPPLLRKKSTLIFTDDYETPEFRENAGPHSDLSDDENNTNGVNSNINHTNSNNNNNNNNMHLNVDNDVNSQVGSMASSYSSVSNSFSNSPGTTTMERPILVPVDIRWEQGGNSVYVTGSFTDWRKMIALIQNKENPTLFNIVLQLPPGTHRFRFIVDGELRISDYLPQATDQLGNFVNFLEISSSASLSQHQHEQEQQQQEQQQPQDQVTQQSRANSSTGGNMISTSEQYPEQQPPSPNIPPQQAKRNAYKIAGSGFTSLDEASKEKSHEHSQMSNSSRLALQIARENDNEPEDIGNGFSRVRPGDKKPLLSTQNDKPTNQYTTDIPAVFTDPHVMEQYYLTLDQQRNNQQYMSWLTPPLLPPHLEKVILNANYSSPTSANGKQQQQQHHHHHSHHNHSNHHHNHQQSLSESSASISSSMNSMDKQTSPQPQSGSINENNSGALPIPNHVVLNHLITSSIKHNTLCVASTVRYKSKYATQILYAPLQ